MPRVQRARWLVVVASGALLVSTLSQSVTSVPRMTPTPVPPVRAQLAADRFGAASDLPNGPILSTGAMGNISAGGSTGALATSVPIAVPRFHGLEPSLALTYNSQATNGWVGVGWDVAGDSYMTRRSIAGGDPDFTASDVFDLDGQTLVACPASTSAASATDPSCVRADDSSTGVTHYTTTSEQHIIVDLIDVTGAPSQETWRVRYRDGHTKLYQPDQLAIGTDVVARWHLSSTSDLAGNTVSYTYAPATPRPTVTPVLSTLSYNGVTVRFYDEPRPDPIDDATTGTLTSLGLRLKTVAVSVGSSQTQLPPSLARAYALTYAIGPGAGRSVLQSITTYGDDATLSANGDLTGPTLPSQTFVTQQPPAQPWATTSHYLGDDSALGIYESDNTYTPGFRNFTGSLRFGAFDGTSRTGVATIRQGCAKALHVSVLNQVSGTRHDSTVSTGAKEVCPSDTSDWWAADANADGYSDVYYLEKAGANQYLDLVFLLLNNGDGTFRLSDTEPVYNFQRLGCAPGDIEGRGRAALLCANYEQDFSGYSTVVLHELKPVGSGPTVLLRPSTYPLPMTPVPTPAIKHWTFLLADANGDGVSDIVNPKCPATVQCPGGVTPGITTFFNTGAGTFTHGVFAAAPVSTWQHAADQGEMADLNSDGMADYFSVLDNGDGSYSTAVAISQGDGGYLFMTQPIPHSFTPPPPLFQRQTPSILLGTGPDGLPTVVRMVDRAAHDGPDACASAIRFRHLEVVRATADGKGGFSWASSLDDCAHTYETSFSTEPTLWSTLTAIGQAYTTQIRGSSILLTPRQPTPGVPADFNGDGTSDLLLLDTASGPGASLRVEYNYSSRPLPGSWLTDDALGTAGRGLVSIEPRNAVPIVRRPVGTPSGCDPVAVGSCSGLFLQNEQLHTPTDPASPTGAQMRATLTSGWRLLDTSGTGRPDLVYIDATAHQRFGGSSALSPAIVILTYRAIAGGFDPNPAVTWLPFIDADQTFGPWLPVDLEGDSHTALTSMAANTRNGVFRLYELRPQPDGTWAEQQQPFDASLPATDLTHWRVVDLDADHRSDLAFVDGSTQNRYRQSGYQVTTLVNHGAGRFGSNAFFHTGAPDANFENWLFADVNSDGLIDLVHAGDTSRPPYLEFTQTLSLGHGAWSQQAPYDPPAKSPTPVIRRGTWRLVDVNSDGRPDLANLAPVLPGFTNQALQRISTWVVSTGPTTYTPRDTILTSSDPLNYQWFGADTDQDGLGELVNVVETATGFLVTAAAPDPQADRLLEIDDGIGGLARFSYAPGAQWRRAAQSSFCLTPKGVGMSTIRTAEVYDGSGNSSTREFSYSCPRWSFAHHRLLGWADTTQNTRGSFASYPSTTSQLHQLSDGCGDETVSSTVADQQGRIISNSSNVYASVGGGVAADCAIAWVTHSNCADRSSCPSDTTEFSYDLYGNTTAETETARLGNTTVQDVRSIVRTYQYDLDRYLVAENTSTTVYGRDGTAVSKSTYCYDDDCAGLAPRGTGKQTDQTAVDLSGGGRSRHIHVSYDAWGNAAIVTDPLQRKTQTTYDPDLHLYPVSVVNALGQSQKFSWNYALGVMTGATDRNLQTTIFGYDSFGRPTEMIPPAGAATHIDYIDVGRPATQNVTYRSDDGSAAGAWTSVAFDGLGRPTVTTRKAASATQVEQTQSVYADAGANVWKQSHWELLDTGTPPDLTRAETYRYDVLGRTVDQYHPDGTSEHWTVNTNDQGDVLTATDENGNDITRSEDAWGRPLTTTQMSSAGVLSTLHYATDPLGQTTGITDDSGTHTGWSYDSFGDVRTETDPARGLTTSTYDQDGEMRTTTDALSNLTTFDYDALGRIIGRTLPGHPADTWRYDETGHGASVGRLTTVRDSSAQGCPSRVSQSRTYDDSGRMSQYRLCVAGRSETFSDGYDAYGRLASLTYPNQETVPYTYDPAGRLQSVGGYAHDARYDASGQLTALTFGDGSTEQLQPDPVRGWESSDAITQGGTTIASTTLTHFSDGAVSSLHDTIAGSDMFGYDAMSRLVSTTGDDPQITGFDAAGNVIVDSGSGTVGYGGAAPSCPKGSTFTPAHAVTSVSFTGSTYPTSMCYNARGDRTATHSAYQDQSLTWNADGTPATITTTTPGPNSATRTVGRVNLTYDAQGAVARQSGTDENGDGFDISNFGSAQWQRGVGLVDYYSFGGMLVARRDSANVAYYHQDRLGSTTLVTDGAGAVVAKVAYSPWGVPTTVSGRLPTGSPGYAGGENIMGTNLVAMGARIYDPEHADFISADPTSPGTGDTQGANRYAYAANDPVNAIDPTGLGDPIVDDSAPGEDLYSYDPDTNTTTIIFGSDADSSSDTGEGMGSVNAQSQAPPAPEQTDSVDPAGDPGADNPAAVAAGTGADSSTPEVQTPGGTNGAGTTPPSTPSSGGETAAFFAAAASSFGKGVVAGLVVGVAFAAFAAAAPVAATVVGVGLAVVGVVSAARSIYTLATGKDASGRLLSSTERATRAGDLVGGTLGGLVGGGLASGLVDSLAGEAVGEAVAAPCANSFPAATAVLLADGKSRPIDQIRPGMTVLTRDPHSGRTSSQPVTAVITHRGVEAVVTVRFADGTALSTTADHPVWDQTQGTFVRAEDLTAGDSISTADQRGTTVISVKLGERTAFVYDLTVAGSHVFYADSVLVHNACNIAANAAKGVKGNRIRDSFGKGIAEMRYPSITNTTKSGFRRIDFFNEKTGFTEIKNVRFQDLTPQLNDSILAAQAFRVPFNLITRAKTNLSPQLARAVADGYVNWIPAL